MSQSVGILAYGSLIPNPGDEIGGAIVERKRNVTTPFNIEFARTSKGRRGAPTLVPVPDGGAQIFAHLLVLDASVEDATDFLYRREINNSGSNRRYQQKDNPGPNDIVINSLENFHGVDVVLYAEIAANISVLTAQTLARLAIGSARGSDDGRDGITYLMDATGAGIETPLTTAYVDEVKRLTGARDLEEALAIARARVSHE